MLLQIIEYLRQEKPNLITFWANWFHWHESTREHSHLLIAQLQQMNEKWQLCLNALLCFWCDMEMVVLRSGSKWIYHFSCPNDKWAHYFGHVKNMRTIICNTSAHVWHQVPFSTVIQHPHSIVRCCIQCSHFFCCANKCWFFSSIEQIDYESISNIEVVYHVFWILTVHIVLFVVQWQKRSISFVICRD